VEATNQFTLKLLILLYTIGWIRQICIDRGPDIVTLDSWSRNEASSSSRESAGGCTQLVMLMIDMISSTIFDTGSSPSKKVRKKIRRDSETSKQKSVSWSDKASKKRPTGDDAQVDEESEAAEGKRVKKQRQEEEEEEEEVRLLFARKEN
jgi:hypothetical protein